jgi:hypothetical protein
MHASGIPKIELGRLITPQLNLEPWRITAQSTLSSLDNSQNVK